MGMACSYSATGYPGNMCFVHKNGLFRGYNPGNRNAVHIFPAYCGWGRSGMDGPGVYESEGKAGKMVWRRGKKAGTDEKEVGADEKGDNCAEEAFL